MQSVNIQTTQNVLIDYQVAGIGDRILSTLIDIIIQTAIIIGISLILARLDLMTEWSFIFFYLSKNI